MIAEVLREGKENAIPAAELCGLLGVTRRDLSRLIEAERRAGAPICSSTARPAGYFIAGTRREMECFGMALYRRAGEIMRTAQACQKAAAALPEGVMPGE